MRDETGKFAVGSKHLVTHGQSRSKLHRIWTGMRSRCLSPNNAAYANYGGRGIGICDRWSDFAAFAADMGEPPEGTSLDRIDNDAGYSPENCRWATRAEQSRNRRNIRVLTIDGETKPLTEWAAQTGISRKTLYTRLAKGWPAKAAVFSPRVQARKGVPRGATFYGDIA